MAFCSSPESSAQSSLGSTSAESRKVVEEAGDLFDRQALARYVSMWIVGPSVALALSYLYFSLEGLGG